MNSFKLKNLQELRLTGFHIDLNEPEFKKLLETIAENIPKLKLLCFTGELENGEWNGYAKICQEFALAKKIKLEVKGYPIVYTELWAEPSDDVQIYSPK